MTDMDCTIDLLNKYGIDYHFTILYSTETNELCGHACWLSKGGHIEFDLYGKITNVVNY